MTVLSTTILIIGLLLLLDSLFVFLFPNISQKLTKRIMQPTTLKKVAIIEASMGLVLIAASIIIQIS